MATWVKDEKFKEAIRSDDPRTYEDAILRYLCELGWAGKSRHTLRAYGHDLRTFTYGGIPLRGWPGTQDLEAWRQRNLDLHQNTFRQRLIRFRAFWKWLVKMGFAPYADPSSWMILPKETHRFPRIPTIKEMWTLITSLGPAKQTVMGRRLLALIYLLIDTGLRINEALSLRWQDINWNDRQIVVSFGKGGKSRTVPFGKMCFLMLDEWYKWAEHKEQIAPVFCTEPGRPMTQQQVALQLRRQSKLAGLDWAIHPHALRHYCATQMLRKGMNIEAVRKMLGHTSLAMTMNYLHMIGKDIRDAHKDASPADWLVREA